MRKITFVLCWLLFLLWLLFQVPVFLRLDQQGRMPIDFLAYHRAAAALQAGASPYLSPERTLAIWRGFHQDEMALLAAQAQGAAARPSCLPNKHARSSRAPTFIPPPSPSSSPSCTSRP
jgi:hypothetical protein